MKAMEENKEKNTQSDVLYEGKDKVYLDIDRIINEGLSGGSVHNRNNTANIEEARDLVKEQPPYESD
jgi:hypothetical protein